MSLQGDVARENDAKFFAEKLKERIEKHKDFPEIVSVLKGLGIETLDTLLDAIPEWAQDYYRLFRS